MDKIKRIVEILLLLLIAIGFNADLIFPSISDFIIIIAVVLCLFWLISVLTSEDKFRFQKMGFTLVLFRIIAPIMTIILTIIAHKIGISDKETTKTKTSIKLELKADSADCSLVKYGLFKHWDDTISRIRLPGGDYEIHNSKDTFRVIWIDSCKYRIQKDNGFFKMYTISEINDNFVIMEQITNLIEKEEIIYERIRE